MLRRNLLLAGAFSLAGRFLLAQVPPEERIPITDPDRLQAMGFPRDAMNVYVWSKAELERSRVLDEKAVATPETWGTAGGYTSVLGHELKPGYGVVLAISPEGILDDDGTSCYDNFYYSDAYVQIQVPDGAKLNALRFWAYDVDPEDLIFDVYETCQPGAGPPTWTLIGHTQTFLAIGDYAGFTPLNDFAVDNRDCAYYVRVQFAPAGQDCRGVYLRVRKLQFTWFRQVSPAPATASFTDVPTNHPYFQHIEALFDSGITAGCSPTMYCPAQPITRGEMAVFLAKALGLNWP